MCLLAICTLTLGFAGCSKKLETYPVTGKVHFPDGKPLEGGVIIFVSKDKGTQSRARIERDGTFTLARSPTKMVQLLEDNEFRFDRNRWGRERR